MDSSIFDNHSKAKVFKKFEHPLYKYYPRFSKIYKGSEHFHQFLILLYNCLSNLSQFLSIDKLFNNSNVSQLGMRKNPAAPLYSKTSKCGIFFDETKTIKKQI